MSRLTARRLELGLTPRAVSRALGVPVRTVEAWEAGEAVPYRRRLSALAELLDWTTDQVRDAIPGYEELVAKRAVYLNQARVATRPAEGPGSEKWLRDQLASMRAAGAR